MVRPFRLIPPVSVTTATLYRAAVARLIEAVLLKVSKIEDLLRIYCLAFHLLLCRQFTKQ